MTPTQADKDRELSFSIINYLSASYRGKLAGFTLLGQLGHASFDEEEISRLLNVTEKISEWFAGLMRGELLFCASWESPETFEAQDALGLLSKLKPELMDTARRVDDFLNGTGVINSEHAKWLFNALTRSSFARDIYLRGFVLYGENFKKHEIAQSYGLMLQQAAQHNDLVQQGIEMMRTAEADLSKLGEEFVGTLLAGCEELPAVFRTHIHDINLLLSNYKGGVSFGNLDFNSEESEAWVLAGVAPDVAGYWRAYGIQPSATAAWLKSFIPDPAAAVAWQLAGFVPDSAKPWTSLGFPIELAKVWHEAGFEPSKAKEQIDRGVMSPSVTLKPEEPKTP